MYWDVFKNARLDNLKARQLDEEELKPKNAKRMRVQHTINIAAKMPKTFNMQTASEVKLLAYVQVRGASCSHVERWIMVAIDVHAD